MPDKAKTSNRKRLLWIAKIILALALCFLVLWRAHLRDTLQVRNEAGQVKEITGRLIGRTDSGDWLWRNARGIQRTIPDSDVIKKAKLNHLGQAEPSFEQGLISLIATAFGSRWVWLAIALLPLEVLLGAWRWQRLLRAGRIRLSYSKALTLTFIGNFFNHTLPSMVGGDVVKAYYLMRSHPKRKSNVVVSLIADRTVGMAGLAIICVAAIITGWSNPLVQSIKVPIFIIVGLLALAVAILFVPGLARALHLVWLTERLPFQHFMDSLRRVVRLYSLQPGIWILATGLSVVIHLILLSCVYLGGRALAPGPGYRDYLLLLPPTWMISAIPITPGGAAWMELWYQNFFSRVGVSATAALSLSLFHRFIMLIWALPGLVFYLKGPGFKSPEPITISRVEQILDIESDASGNSRPRSQAGQPNSQGSF